MPADRSRAVAAGTDPVDTGTDPVHTGTRVLVRFRRVAAPPQANAAAK